MFALLFAVSVFAHEGHDHGKVTTTVAPITTTKAPVVGYPKPTTVAPKPAKTQAAGYGAGYGSVKPPKGGKAPAYGSYDAEVDSYVGTPASEPKATATQKAYGVEYNSASSNGFAAIALAAVALAL
ncbi:hypothetical protein BC833DRAFT_625207 [Globomyces pollinis-pini]|nr:hypothetical protein BC833DRAFT_625207 [Globomyces pollinis-pini]KAJ2991166.1 hypothetical protein HDV02_003931 [Globomyces sp. JEL0801]